MQFALEPALERTTRTTWRELLAAHWDVLAATDCCTVEGWTPRGLPRFTVLVLIHLASRRVQIAGISAEPEAVGIEGTGGYGVGLSRTVHRAGHRVVEVNRVDRRLRRAAGKSDTIDAEAAARAVLAGQATATPKTADGAVEMMRQLKVARDSAVKARTTAMSTLTQILVNAPPVRCFRHQLLLPSPYLVLTKSLRLDIQCQRAASVKIGWKYLDD